MESQDLFDGVSHHLRIDILKALSRKPLRFADLKRRFKIDSSGQLDFHLKKLDDLITVNGEGCYALTEKGYAALQAVDVVSKYGWQRSAFFINLAVCVLLNAYLLYTYFFVERNLIFLTTYLAVVVPTTFAWMLFYGYWTFVKRRIHLRNST
jgi:DNA-binding HxlR family transcriptional regulator